MRVERTIDLEDDIAPNNHVTRPGDAPVNLRSGLERWSMEELPFNCSVRRTVFELGKHRAQYSVCAALNESFVESQQPVIRRLFIVVDERH